MLHPNRTVRWTVQLRCAWDSARKTCSTPAGSATTMPPFKVLHRMYVLYCMYVRIISCILCTNTECVYVRCMYVCIFMSICMNVCIFIRICMYVYMAAAADVCMYVCMYVRTYESSVFETLTVLVFQVCVAVRARCSTVPGMGMPTSAAISAGTAEAATPKTRSCSFAGRSSGRSYLWYTTTTNHHHHV